MQDFHNLLLKVSVKDIMDSIMNHQCVIINKIMGTKFYVSKRGDGSVILKKPNHQIIDHIELVKSNLYVKQYQKCHKLKSQMTTGHIYEMVFTYNKSDAYLSSIKDWNNEYILDPLRSNRK